MNKTTYSCAKGRKRAPRAVIGAIALAAASLASGLALAAPAVLANDADVAAFAMRVKNYASASRVHWVIAARTRGDAEALIAKIAAHLPPDDRELAKRVKAEAFADDPDIAPNTSIPVAWMTPQIGQSQAGPSCNWQVWVADPTFPSLADNVVNVPLAPNDRLPVSPKATFRVGYTGLLQSKLYAFGETRPGAIRDLASAPDVNIPVATGAGARNDPACHGAPARAFLRGNQDGTCVERRAKARSRRRLRPARQGIRLERKSARPFARPRRVHSDL